jgi:repressor LexA
MNAELTDTQDAVYRYLIRYVEANGRQPTNQEIAERFGWNSKNGAHCHLVALEKKGLIRLRKARGVELIGVRFKAVFEDARCES